MALSRFVLPFVDVGSGISPSSGAKLFFYATGTSTPATTFSDSAGSIPNANPVIADANGVFPSIFLSGTFKVILKDKNDVQIREADPVDFAVSETFFNTIDLAIADEDLTVGGTVITLGYNTVGDGGQGTYAVVGGGTGANDGGLFIDLDNGQQLQLAIEGGTVSVEQFGAAAYDMNASVWPSAGAGFIDSTIPINKAFATGLTVVFAHTIASATYRATDELLVNTEGQYISGQGAGELQLNFFALKQGTSWKTRILFHGTPTKYTKTRRQPRLSFSDPEDAATASAVNIQGAFVDFSKVLIDLEVDYDDLSPSNLGADYDHGVMTGTRHGVHVHNVHIRGYFRVASYYVDNTRLGPDYPFVTPEGVTYSADAGVNNGTDKTRGDNVITAGGRKGLFIAGPIDGDNTNYYDEIAGMLITDSRGGFGTSDSLFTRCFFGGPDHHSGYRRYDPPLNDAMDRIDPSKVVIDDAAGSYFYDSRPADNASRRVKFDTCRFTTIESVRIFIGNGREMIFDNPVTESLSGTVRDTGGTIIDQYDYTLQSFKDLACFATDYDGSGSGAKRISFLQSGGTPNLNYFQNLVPEHYVTIVGNDPSAIQKTDYDCRWLNIAVPTTQTVTTTAQDRSQFFDIQIIGNWTGLNTTDPSVATIAVVTGTAMAIGDSGVLKVDQELSTGLPFVAEGTGPYTIADAYELRIGDQTASSSTRFLLYKNGIKQRYSDGMLAAGQIVATGIASDTGL